MSWQPNQGGVQQIVSLLTEFQNPNADQHRILAELDKCRAFPDFNNYLAFIFANGEGLAVEVRQSAGLLLKNNLRIPHLHAHSQPTPHPAYVKSALLSALQLPERPLRHTAGTCIVTIVNTESGIASWPELLPALVTFLQAAQDTTNTPSPPSPEITAKVEGALDTCYKLWEEAPLSLEQQSYPPSTQQSCPSDTLVPAILPLFSFPDPSMRALALSTINLSVCYLSRAIVTNKATYLQGLFTLANDPSPDVRKAVCSGLVNVVGVDPEWLDGNLQAVIEYMLVSSQDSHEEVAIEASEFWSAYPESGLDVSALREYLPRLLPVLLKNMVFDEYDEEVMEAEAEEEAALTGQTGRKDTDADIKPTHITSASATSHSNVDDGNENDDDDDDDDDEVSKWNLRRCSAAGLDMLSNAFGDELLPLLLPAVQVKLGEVDWRAREGAILALGAVSEGCAGGLSHHLPSIVGALLPFASDPRPMVRSIACWSLTRYSRPMIDRAAAGDASIIHAVVDALCERLSDHNRKVQEAACGSIATLAEEAAIAALPFVGKMLSALSTALMTYSRKTLRNAYDAVASIADHVPRAFETPEGSSLVLPRLFAKLSESKDGERDVLPLLECIGCVAQSAGNQLGPYAEIGFKQCVDIADRMHAAALNGAVDKDEADDFVVAALDALSGMVEGLGAGVESLVARSALVDVLAACCSDGSPDVRQSAFALVGDLARTCLPHLKSKLGEILSLALTNLEPQAITQANIRASNNAAWCIGELSIVLSHEEVAQFALPAVERLVRVISAPAGGLPRSLIENCAIALGRISCIATDAVAPHATAFMAPWCSALRNIRDGAEKEQAFSGLCAVVKSNPAAGAGAFAPLCEAVVSWRTMNNEVLRSNIVGVMQGYKVQLVEMGQWEVALESLREPVARKLVDMCQL